MLRQRDIYTYLSISIAGISGMPMHFDFFDSRVWHPPPLSFFFSFFFLFFFFLFLRQKGCEIDPPFLYVCRRRRRCYVCVCVCMVGGGGG